MSQGLNLVGALLMEGENRDGDGEEADMKMMEVA